MPKKSRVLAIGTEVVVIKDTVSHCIPKGKVSRITFWDGSDTAPVYKLEGHDTMIWFTDIKPTESTTTAKKPKEPKTMSTTKKSETGHGKTLRVPAKGTVKPKYPAARPFAELIVLNYRNPGCKVTKAHLIDEVFNILEDANENRRELATTGTKLDRALVDLKEAKKRIKELEAAK